MNNIDTAVILAAGTGSRMVGTNGDKPKGFIQLEGLTLIERSLSNLIKSGIKQIIIGTGYQNAYYEALKCSIPITCVYNPHFATTGSMSTFLNLRDKIKSSFLLLESDLLYDAAGLQLLLHDPHQNVILASGFTHSGDEVFIETTTNGKLLNMSKNPALLQKTNAELVGISKLSFTTYQKMCFVAEKLLPCNSFLDYESVMVKVGKKNPFHVHISESYVWCEIDDPAHYQRALSEIYPRLKKGFE